ncbi:MAG TPA: hypothetical protein VF602_05160 [Pedobacter sp.]|jgi:hypothetical protein
MKLLTLFFLAILISSCNNNSGEVQGQDSTINLVEIKPTDLCFQRLEGTKNQDTTTINLKIAADEVNGVMNSVPKEKDSRKGTLKGQKHGDVIKALWSYKQEGKDDTLSVEFKLTENGLLQKTFEIDKITQKQYLSAKSKFSIPFMKIACK